MDYELCVKLLFGKYNTTVLDKKQVAEELKLSESTFDNYMAQGKAPVSFTKEQGSSEKGKVLYTIFDVAKFLTKERELVWRI